MAFPPSGAPNGRSRATDCHVYGRSGACSPGIIAAELPGARGERNPATSPHVQVFGCRDDERRLALRRPASKKRQGTKSREVWRRLGGARTDRHRTPWGDAINFDGSNARPVRDFVIENAEYWVDAFHLDGLRLDAVHSIKDDTRPDIIDELAERLRSRFERPIHLLLENERNEPEGIVRLNSILPAGAPARDGAPLFLLRNRPTRSARFDAENDLYSFALTVPFPAMPHTSRIGAGSESQKTYPLVNRTESA